MAGKNIPRIRRRSEAGEVDVRLQQVERTVSEQFLELRHGQRTHGEAIQAIQADMHKLVRIAEQQIELAQKSAENSRGLERAFTEMGEHRAELLAALREAAKDFKEWKQDHEKDNKAVADLAAKTATGYRTAVQVLAAVFGVVAMLSAGWLTVQFDRVNERVVSGDQANAAAILNHVQQDRDDTRRLETRLDQLQYQRQEVKR